jgi:hypothetical protein
LSAPPLRGCPLCKTKVTEVQLGLRDYRWITDRLPGKVAPMDGDFILERNGDFLFMEFRQPGEPISMGKRITIEGLRALEGVEFWIVEAPDEHGPETEVKVTWNETVQEVMSRQRLEEYILKWYDARSAVRRGNRTHEKEMG